MDLIDRDVACQKMTALYEEDCKIYGVSIPECFDSDRAIEALKELPSTEKTGKWIQHPIYEGSDHCYYACSECDYRSWSRDNYCSVCGARMEEKDEIN